MGEIMECLTEEAFKKLTPKERKGIFKKSYGERFRNLDKSFGEYMSDFRAFSKEYLGSKDLFTYICTDIKELESKRNENIDEFIKKRKNNAAAKIVLEDYIKLLKTISNNTHHISDEEYSDYQAEIQNIEPATQEEIENLAVKPPNIIANGQSETISRNSRIAKKVLIDSNYTCQIDPTHRTFTTKQGKNYMEVHHLIPCSVKNSKEFYEKYGKNIDCPENIICICPTCHRAVHLGNQDTKKEKIKSMFAKQSEKLSKIGIKITEEELLKRYYSPR